MAASANDDPAPASAVLTRRSFLRAMAVAGGGLAVLGPLALADRPAARAARRPAPGEWLPNVCTMCPSGCSIRVQIDPRGGRRRAIKIDGNPNDPFNQGRICARGQSGLRLAYSPARITQPLIRVAGSKRGEWRFRAATWEDAYAYIDRVTAANAIQPYETALAAGWIICADYRPPVISYAIASGIPNIYGTPLQPCVSGAHFGVDTVTGNFNIHDEVQADYAHARYFLAIGSNAAVVGISTGRALRFAQGMGKARVVVLDPRMSELAAHADQWLPVKPGTDLAFTLAMLQVITSGQLYDVDFVTRHTNAPFLLDDAGNLLAKTDSATGFASEFYVYDRGRNAVVAVPGIFHNDNTIASDGRAVQPALHAPRGLVAEGKAVRTVFDALTAKLAPFSPEWAAPITDVPAATIRQVATEFATTRPALVEPGWHDGRYANSIMLRRTAALLQTLVGGLDTTGGWIFSGEYHQMVAELTDFLSKGGDMSKYPPMKVPGLMSPQEALAAFFNNPHAWSHGHPSLSYVWSQQQFAVGHEGVAWPLFPNSGYMEAAAGEVAWQGQPYRLRSFWMYQANPVRNAMSSTQWERFLADPQMKLVVAIDVAPNDSNAYADVILPDQVYLERQDLLFGLSHANEVGLRLRSPAITPPKETKPGVDILAELAARHKAPFVQTLAMVSGWDVPKVAAAVNHALAAGGSAVEAIAGYQLDAAARTAGMQTSDLRDRLARDGVLVQQTAHQVHRKWAMPALLPLPTPSGRAELFSEVFAGFVRRHGYRPNWDPLVAWIAPDTPAGGGRALAANEFYFAYGKTPVQTHTATADNDLLAALTRNFGPQYLGIWINPARARPLGIAGGDRITLRNTADGSKVSGVAFVTEMIRPDTVFMMSDFGVKNPKLPGAGTGVALGSLVPSRSEPVVGAPRSGELTVTVAKL